jgi:uncharacterized membrane protein YeaQ/YmgE (transglycosylase-associated protein family)
MGIVSWIIFGALVGWVASLLTGQSERTGCLANIIIGIAGSLVGGFLGWLIFRTEAGGFTAQHFLTALIGALLLLTIYGWWVNRQATAQ